jgi:dolichol-phosphate mannosyltransferase
MKVVVLLPTYNEKENILTLLGVLRAVLIKLKKHDFEILVIDDTSPDGTANIVKEYIEKHKEVKLILGKKEGLGKALLRGMNFAVNKLGADIVLQMDADLSHNPEAIPFFIEKIEKGYDFVVGSRYIKGGSIPSNWGIHRKIYSVLGNSIVRFGLGHISVHDWTGGYRAYKRQFVDIIAPEMVKHNGYVFQIAFLYKAISKGAKISEVPIQFTDRRFGRSKIIFSEYIIHIFEFIIQERLKLITNGPFGKFLVVGGIGLLINTLILEILVHNNIVPWISNMIGAECAIISNFLLNNSWTFNNRSVEGKKALGKFIQFNLTSIIGVTLIQTGVIWLGTHFFGVNTYRFWFMIGTGLLLIWNYFMYSRVIWKK